MPNIIKVVDSYLTSRLHARRPTELDVVVVIGALYTISPMGNFIGPELSDASKEFAEWQV